MSLYVEETGTQAAPTILFLHALATGSWMWQWQTEHLTDYHCLAVDLPGHGKSNQTPWISLEDVTEQLAVIIRERATNGKVHVVALSLGSYVALELLNRYADLVDHAILSGLNVLPLNLGVYGLLGPIFTLLFKTNFMLRANAKALNIPESSLPVYLEHARETSRQAFSRVNREVAQFRPPVGLANVPCPLLIVAGQNEHTLIHQSQALLVRTFENAQGRIAPGVGHGWSVEAPDLFTRMIRAWIEDKPLPAELLPFSEKPIQPGTI